MESIIKTNKKEGIEFIEKTLKNTDGETERIIWEKLKYYKVKLPSGLNILNEKSFSNKESIKNYYFSIMPENEIVDKIKELVIKNKEDYTKDAIFIDNCGEIINSLSSNKEDMKVNEKLIKLIIYYSNSLNDASNEVSRVESNLSGLRNNINENFRNIHKKSSLNVLLHLLTSHWRNGGIKSKLKNFTIFATECVSHSLKKCKLANVKTHRLRSG